MNDNIPSDKKIILIGDGGSGKTSFVTRFKDGNFRREYIATIGAVCHPIKLTTTLGDLNVTIWDTAGQECNAGLGEAYYMSTDLALIFFDLTSRITLKNVKQWNSKLRIICPNVPIIVIGTKADLKDKKTRACEIKQKLTKYAHYVEISSKTNYNFEVVLSKIVGLLTGMSNILYIPAINLEPAELTIGIEQVKESNERMSMVEVTKMDLPDDDDERGL